ncbi:hypothetical protein [Mesorhizobium mediterraneum]|uniref:hypothetical protein n=1 Tax=Mesorhizobium mediterraneum TaxID=43617 RepID=UPI00177FF5C1|nr:hypothetical protein [Mesorhizobium mediterraneum]
MALLTKNQCPLLLVQVNPAVEDLPLVDAFAGKRPLAAAVFIGEIGGIAAQRFSQRHPCYFSGCRQVRHGNKDVSKTARFCARPSSAA